MATSLMSLCAGWPPFDYAVRNGIYYLRVKSDQLIRIKVEQEGKKLGSDIAIIPTDDERLKILTIPMDILEHFKEPTLAQNV